MLMHLMRCVACCHPSRVLLFFFVRQKTAYEMRISDWSSDVCSSDRLVEVRLTRAGTGALVVELARDDGTSLDAVRRPLEVVEDQRLVRETLEIGRASCRERVCQYV